jgi:hypothetical protein
MGRSRVKLVYSRPIRDEEGRVVAVHRLKVAQGLSLSGKFVDALLAFKPKPDTPDGLDGWREQKDDDLVLAVASAVWAAERFWPPKESVHAGTWKSYPSPRRPW